MKQKIEHWDERAIVFFRRTYIPLARVAFFIIFFWFGFLKLVGVSPAGELAEVLTAKTIGLDWFDFSYKFLALLECVIGVLFLIPRAARVVVPLLFAHLLVVCSPLILVPELTWQSFMVPTLEGQYIIKNVAIVALAFGVAAHTRPLKARGVYNKPYEYKS
ncbi:MAG: hypothetical protein ACREGD_02955 [Candidatus Saccharimonadales bacterium]